jgi:hypothetical protein
MTPNEGNEEGTMPKYVIERRIPGAGQLSPVELRTISKQSVGIVNELGRGLTWLQSFVTDDRIYCIYASPSVELIQEHARCMGIPANAVHEIRTEIGPQTAEG